MSEQSIFQWAAGSFTALLTGWLTWLHNDMAKMKAEIAENRRSLITRSEMKEELSEATALHRRETARLERNITQQYVQITRALERLESRIDNRRDHAG